MPGWGNTGWLLLSPRAGIPAICSLLPETEIQGMHALPHIGTRLQACNLCSFSTSQWS